jgi:hypothetical protein
MLIVTRHLPRKTRAPVPAGIERQTELDWLRGLMLVLMTITHLPTWFSSHVGQPFGFVSAAEGFVFLSAYLVGTVYSHIATTRGYDAMRRALWLRALKVYGAHIGLLLFLVWLLVPIATRHGAVAITDLASFYVAQPKVAVLTGLLLVYNPPLLDILPMYVVFLLLSPVVVAFASRRGWGGLLTLSAALWFYAQLGGGRHLYGAIAALVDWPVPYSQTGAFAWLGWQLLWLIGLRAGAVRLAEVRAETPRRSWSPWVLGTAASLAALFFVWRHAIGQVPFGSDVALNALFDKWHLGPLRLLNFAVLAVIVVQGRRVLAGWGRRSSIATLGRASLTVFSAHLVVCLSVLAAYGEDVDPQLGLLDAGLLLGTLVTLYAFARAALDGGEVLRSQWRAARAEPAKVRVERPIGR